MHGADAVVDVVAVAGPIDVARFHEQPETVAGFEHGQRGPRHVGERRILRDVGRRVADRAAIFGREPFALRPLALRHDHRRMIVVGGGEGEMSLGGAEEAEEPEMLRDRVLGRLGEHLRAEPPRRAHRHAVAAACRGIDRPQGRGRDILVAALEVPPLAGIVGGIDAESAADEDVEAGQRPASRNRRLAELIAGDVLIVVAADVRRVGAGRRGM